MILTPLAYRPISAENLRKRLELDIEKYVNQHYPKGICSIFTRTDSDIPDSREYVILIEDHEFQPQNRWNGKWRSEWMASMNEDGTVCLQGGAKVHVHYYEDSNVQLVTKQLYDKITIEGITSEAADADIAAGITKIIKKLETRYQQSLRDNYWGNFGEIKILGLILSF